MYQVSYKPMHQSGEPVSACHQDWFIEFSMYKNPSVGFCFSETVKTLFLSVKVCVLVNKNRHDKNQKHGFSLEEVSEGSLLRTPQKKQARMAERRESDALIAPYRTECVNVCEGAWRGGCMPSVCTCLHYTLFVELVAPT